MWGLPTVFFPSGLYSFLITTGICGGAINTCKSRLELFAFIGDDVIIRWHEGTAGAVQTYLESQVPVFVVEPLMHGVSHIEGQPFAFRSRFHNLAIDVALRWGR